MRKSNFYTLVIQGLLILLSVLYLILSAVPDPHPGLARALDAADRILEVAGHFYKKDGMQRID